jgi:hypothetical protein
LHSAAAVLLQVSEKTVSLAGASEFQRGSAAGRVPVFEAGRKTRNGGTVQKTLISKVQITRAIVI